MSHQARPARYPSGVTLTEVLVAVAIVAILTAMVIPAVYGRLDGARADAIIQEMQTLQNGILLYYRDVGRYPLRLDYLDSLTSVAANQKDACGNQIPTANAARYRGPYINKPINMINPPSNTKYLLSTGDSVESAITRTLVGSTQVIQIWVYKPEFTIADLVDQKVDGVADGTLGTIMYTAVAAPQDYIIKWTFAIKTGAC